MKLDSNIFKAYDIRGTYPDQIDNEGAYAIAQGYANVVKPSGPVLVGCDVRLHSEEMKEVVIQGLNDAGIDVVDVGLISTEMYYFGVGKYGYAGGIQVTASHNPPEWHGMKMVRENVVPISGDTGIKEIQEFAQSGQKLLVDKKGTVEKRDILDEFCKYALEWINPAEIKPLKVVYNPNFGFEGKVFEKIIEMGKLPIEKVPLNAEPDGHFPKGRPDPFIPSNRAETVELVKSSRADLGVAWDADADRVFFVTDTGLFLEPYYTNTLLIKKMLQRHPGAKIIYDPRNTWALVDATLEAGGEPVLERVGHSFIKARMRKDDAVFSGESSGHTYYRDFWYADTGMIPLLQIIEAVSESGKKLSELLAPVLAKYHISGEFNFRTEKAKEIMEQMAEKFADSKIERIDGVSCEYDDWRFNLRTSNTEPLLRINVEARSKALMEEKFKYMVDLIGIEPLEQ